MCKTCVVKVTLLIEEAKEDANQWRRLPHSRTGRLNTVEGGDVYRIHGQEG